MTVESVGATALGVLRPGARKVLLAGSLTVATGVALVLPTPAAHARVIEGTERNDHIAGTAQIDLIRALGGDDVVRSRGGGDDVFGGPGNDIIFGGDGGEVVIDDGFGDDELHGGAGRDQMWIGHGDDVAFGGRGPDHINVDSAPSSTGGRDSVHGGPGNDFIDLEADGRADLIACGPGRDTVTFNLGRDAGDQTAADCEVVKLLQ
jgi:Ca2+-binding RTX toxin-like protein